MITLSVKDKRLAFRGLVEADLIQRYQFSQLVFQVQGLEMMREYIEHEMFIMSVISVKLNMRLHGIDWDDAGVSEEELPEYIQNFTSRPLEIMKKIIDEII